MIPFRRRKGEPDADTRKGVSDALHSSYDPSMDEDEDERMKALIEKMRDFEGSQGGEK